MKNPRSIALSTSRSGITLFKWGALLLFTIAFWLRVSPAFAVDEVEFFCNGSSGATCDVFQVDGGNTSTGAADTCVRGEFRCPTTAEEENPVWPADWDALLFPSNLLPSPIPPTEGSPPGAWSFATPWGGSGSFGGIITSTLVSTGTSTILKQGTKNTDDLSKWVVATQSSPPKDAYLAAALASYSSPGGAGTLPGDLLLYFASTRFSPNGSATVGIWFFQENVFVCPSGTAMCAEDSSGNIVPANHTNGDLFLFLTYSGGGEASIQAAKWIGNGTSGFLGPATNLVTCPTPNDQACAVTNQLSSITLGKSSTASQALGEGFNVSGPGFAGFPGGVVPTLQFQEGGVDVNSIFGGPAPCFSSVLFASISSGSSPNTAAMKSILLGSFNTCAISATKSCGNAQLNTSTGTITYTISGDVTDTGGGAMENLSIADTFNGSPQTISSLACSCSSDCSFDGPPGCTTAVVQPGGTVHYSAMFTTAANGGMDTVTATMAGVGGGFATATSNTASCPSVGQPRLTTTATASGPSISDTGHLTGATAAAGGTITFHLFSDAACMTEVKTGLSPVSVNGNGNYNSGSFTPTAAGTYYWTASYSGDTNNFPVSTKCGEAGESVNAPSISTRLSASAIAVGQSVTDSATLHNATSDAGGTVTYSVFNNNTCTGTPVANGGTVTVTGGVVPNSNSVTFNSAGTFYWQASYSGDAHNASAKSACTSEQLTVIGPCILGYPDHSNDPRSSVTFNESSVLRAFNTYGSGSSLRIAAFYSDEHAMELGIRQNTVKTASGTTVVGTYPVSPLPSSPASASPVQVGSTDIDPVDADGIDQDGVDTALGTTGSGGGRPMFPALFVTDITDNPSPTNRSGDWQQGPLATRGAYPPNAVFGTWKSATRWVDKTKTPFLVTITVDKDPLANSTLGPGSDPPPPFAVKAEAYQAEASWNASSLGLAPGHVYRLQFMVHDGDQNKTGGDSGEDCVNVIIPE